MKEKRITVPTEAVPLFERDFYGSPHRAMRIGDGAIGGKAAGLAFIEQALARFSEESPVSGVEVTIPRFVVLGTDLFDRFMERNGLRNLDFEGMTDEHIAHRFQQANLPAEDVGSLRALIAAVSSPLAVRSSSRLEDAMYEPFAGVYATKMIPNNQLDVTSRFRKLTEAIKFCFASTFFRGAREYVALTGRSPSEEKMALIIQEVIGRRHGDRFYPHLSGVARSYNYYPVGRSRPEEGVVDLALGLGKTIVDGGV
jgi:phosphoenolpyruvate synthase/pyruvate phosphate dikinase